MRFNMSSVAPFSSVSSADGLFGSEGVGSTTQPDFAALFNSYLDDDDETGGESQSSAAGPLASAQDNDILQQIAAGDSTLGAKFEKDMKSGDKKAILNDIQNALHEGLISKDAASQFMQQPDMEKLFKGTHMATHKGYEDVINEDDTRGFDGGKGGSDLLKAGDKYDAEQVGMIFAKIFLGVVAAAALVIPGVGEAVAGAMGGVAAGVAVGIGEGASAAVDVATGVSSTVAGVVGSVSDAAGSVADGVGSVVDGVSDAISPATDAVNQAVNRAVTPAADLFDTTNEDLLQSAQDATNKANDAANFAQQQERNVSQQQDYDQQQAALQLQALQAQAAVGA
jgi:hypothetical protein